MNRSDFRQLIVAEVHNGQRRSAFWIRVLKTALIGHGGQAAVATLRLHQYACIRGWKPLASMLQGWLETRFGCYVSGKSTIGKGLKLPHPVGIVIGDGVTIGEHCMIFQHVTIGGARRGDAVAKRYPTIGDNVIIFAGAVIVGAINVGSNVVIGANSVVLEDVPDGATVAGVPARIVSRKSTEPE